MDAEDEDYYNFYLLECEWDGPLWLSLFKNYVKYTVNGLRFQANVASAVLTQIEHECTCSVPKV